MTVEERIRANLSNHENLCEDQSQPCGDCRRLQAALLALIAHEQVTLLERIEREVIGVDEAFNAGNSRYVDDRNELRTEQRTALAAMKAELTSKEEK